MNSAIQITQVGSNLASAQDQEIVKKDVTQRRSTLNISSFVGQWDSGLCKEIPLTSLPVGIFEPERKMKHLGSWIPISSSSLGLSWYHLVRLQRKPGLPAWRTVFRLQYIGNTDCLYHVSKVWPLLMCCALLFLRLVQTYTKGKLTNTQSFQSFVQVYLI